MNMQLAVKDGELYMIEVNPRASRTVPFVSKSIGVPLASYASRCMLGETLEQIGFTEEVHVPYVSVKEAVFPFVKFPGVDITLSPEMKSTGEVMSIDRDRGLAYLKSQLASGNKVPSQGNIFVSLKDEDKQKAVPLIRQLVNLGYELYATRGTSTIEDAPSPVTQSFEFEASPLTTGATAQVGLISAMTAADTAEATKTSWFTAVKVPA